MFLVRSVYAGAVPLLRERLDHFPRSVVLAATPEDALAWRPHGRQPVIELEDVLTFDGRLELDVGGIEARLRSDRPAPEPKASGPRPGIAAKIKRLEVELEHLLRESRDRAQSTAALTGVPTPLPRPTRSELGRLAGLKPYDVTRCFDHPSATYLRYLWDQLGDPAAVMTK